MANSMLLLLLVFFFVTAPLQASTIPSLMDQDDIEDLNLGGDIFSDFNEDLEASQVMEDERYYRYGRYYSFAINLGLTEFNGNRGIAYENNHPTLGISIYYFLNFQSSFGLGVAYSKHHMFVGEPTLGFTELADGADHGPGFIEVNMLRTFFGMRYYLDTSDLGTAITYSNPYVCMRVEYWYQTNKYTDQPLLSDESGGGLGFSAGGGLEFPIELKKTFLGIEMLTHSVNYFDKYTQKFRAIEGGQGGYEDLTGFAFTSIVSYTINW